MYSVRIEYSIAYILYVDKYLLHRSGWTFEKFFFIGFLSESRKNEEEEEKRWY